VIRGEFDPSDSYPKPWVRVFMNLQGSTSAWTEVRFLRDTGAGITCLHPRDALKLGASMQSLVTPSAWNRSVRLRGVGGSMQYFEASASYASPMTDGNLHIIDRTIMVAKARRDNRGLPSLLGWDILRDVHLTIHQDTGLVELAPITPNILQVPGAP